MVDHRQWKKSTNTFNKKNTLESVKLCHLRFPTADSSSQDNDQHRSHFWPHQHPWDLNVHGSQCHSAWNHEFSNRTWPPPTSRLPGARPRMFASDTSWGSDVSQASPAPITPSPATWSHRPTCPSSSSRGETRRTPSVRSPLGIPEESIVQEKWSCAEDFVFFLLAVSAMPPTDSSASWRQCHSPHNSSEPWVLCASAAAQTPGFALLCPHSCPSARTRDQSLSSWFPSAVQRPTPTSSQTPWPQLRRMPPSSLTTAGNPPQVQWIPSGVRGLSHRWDPAYLSELELSRSCWSLALHRRVQILLPLELSFVNNLLRRHRHRHSSEFLKLVQQEIAATRQVNTLRRIPGHSKLPRETPTASPAFHRTQARQATTVKQTRSPESTTPQLSVHQ